MIGRLQGGGSRWLCEHEGRYQGCPRQSRLTSIMTPSPPYQVEEGQVGHNWYEHERYCEGHTDHAEDQASTMVRCPRSCERAQSVEEMCRGDEARGKENRHCCEVRGRL